MLIQFSLTNFKSFKDTTVFQMTASDSTKHEDTHVHKLENGMRVLRSGLIFGANASGKSNLIEAMSFAKDVVRHGSSVVLVQKKYFRIDNSFIDKTGDFQFDIMEKGELYSYGFSVSYKTGAIVSEWLYNISSDNPVIVFERTIDKDGHIKIESKMGFGEDRGKFLIYADEMNNIDKRKDETFLDNVVGRVGIKHERATVFKDFINVYTWMSKLVIIGAESIFTGINEVSSEGEQSKVVGELLHHLDTGIISLDNKKVEIDIDKILQTEKGVEWIKGGLIEDIINLKNGEEVGYEDTEGVFVISREEDKLYMTITRFNHGNEDDIFGYKDESTGTRRLINILPMFSGDFKDCVVILDEIDRGLHSAASQKILDYFYANYKGNSPLQLIVTTHNSRLMNTYTMRLDELWLVERGKDQASTIMSIAEYDIDEDIGDLYNHYLIGRYGGIPNFKYTDALNNDSEESG